jgi:hypothetical protein
VIEIIQIEGGLRQYEDADFLPIKQSLYDHEDLLPSYDEESMISWHRPNELTKMPGYFSADFTYPRVNVGKKKHRKS